MAWSFISSNTSVWWLLFIMGRLIVYLRLSLLRFRWRTIAWKLQSFSTSLSEMTSKHILYQRFLLWDEKHKETPISDFQKKQKKKTNFRSLLLTRHHYCLLAFGVFATDEVIPQNLLIKPWYIQWPFVTKRSWLCFI